MKAMKQKEQANRSTQRDAEKYPVSLGRGGQAAGGGKGRASAGSATKTTGQAPAWEGGQEADRVGDCRENPHLPDRGKGR